MWLEQKYIGVISSRLDRFRRVNRTLFNFRCPLCGDSTKNKHKCRGYFFSKDDGHFLFHCHNCHVTKNFDKFLEQIDPVVFGEYLKEKLEAKYNTKTAKKKDDLKEWTDKMKTPVFVKTSALKTLKKISQLSVNHMAKYYVISRELPKIWHSKLFYTDKFKEFVNTIIPNKFESVKYDEPRLIIPFIGEDKKLFGFQGRSFSNQGLRYITIMLDESKPKIFGLDTCDRTKIHHIFEGPIDSMFIENALAMAGGSYPADMVNDKSVFVYDNEPRKKETIKKIAKSIKMGYNVGFFPDKYKDKDINDMVLAGAKAKNIRMGLCMETYSGLEAELKLNEWRKV